MSERATQLHRTADTQIAELIELVSTLQETTLRLPSPRREKLGDGTIAASVWHTAENYQRIAAFIQAGDHRAPAHAPSRHGAHRLPRFLRALGAGAADPSEHAPGAARHDTVYSADNVDRGAVTIGLQAARTALGQIAELTDSQLDAIPAKDSFRFCDGQRTFQQVLTGLLKHQGHQLDALSAALA